LIFQQQKLAGLVLISPDVFSDNRGFFMETYNQKTFVENGIKANFVQDNHSFSTKGVLRGLHFQANPFAQDKLVRVSRGRVRDVVVDLRPQSATLGQWQSFILSAKNQKMLFIPKGFAHGFTTLSTQADFQYKCSDFYHPEAQSGILWNDPELKINWRLKNPILSQKDELLPLFSQIKDSLK
jgi:dTDP-4-dehydrorhamnose 3,5-epimerase